MTDIDYDRIAEETRQDIAAEDAYDEMTACRMLLIDMGYEPGEPYTPEPEDPDVPF